MAAVGRWEPFNENVESFGQYVERLGHQFEANAIEDDRKRAIFLSILTPTHYGLLRSLVAPDNLTTKTYQQLVQVLQNHFSPVPSEIVERFKFNSRTQKMGESMAIFLSELRKLAEFCNYGNTLDVMLRDRLVCGVFDEQIKTRLLAEPNLTLANATTIAVAMESAARDAVNLGMQGRSSAGEHSIVNKMHRLPETFRNKKVNHPKESDSFVKPKMEKQSNYKSSDVSKYETQGKQNKCMRCGDFHHNSSNCVHMNSICFFCGKEGHLSKVCLKKKFTHKKGTRSFAQSNRVHTVNDDQQDLVDIQQKSSEVKEYHLYNVESSLRPPDSFKYIFCVNGSNLEMEIDTGAAVSLISKSVYDELNLPEIQRVSTVLATFTGQQIKVLGSVNVYVEIRKKRAELPLLVVSEEGPSLCGRNWIKELQLLSVQLGRVNQMPVTAPVKKNLCEILHDHQELYQDSLGLFKGVKVRLVQREMVQPKFYKARTVPFAMRDKVAAELDRLQATGVISPVRVSDWAAPIVPVLKADKSTVRICGDFKVTANLAIDTDQYPLPKADDIFATLAGGKKFSKLDLKDAYNQLELHEDSKKLVVINTHRGLFQYNRLPFGVSSAPAVFEREIETLLKGIPFCAVSLDDVLITGRNDEEHLASLDEAMSRIQSAGLKLKKNKCEFMMDSIIFLGHKLDSEGIRPTEEKLKAILEAREPSNVSELRSFLGLLTYYAKFLPNMSSMLSSLYALTQKGVEWKWTNKEKSAFNEAKHALKVSTVLVHFDPTKETILSCDASPYGVGAVLAQKDDNGFDRPICFASRTLSKAEKNYAHIEKEALALVFAVTKFRNYLLGRSFTLVTDHRPLVSIFSESKCIPSVAASRIQRWALTLAAYNYRIRFRCGRDNQIADALSRLPLPEKPEEVPKPAETVLLLSNLKNCPVSARDLMDGTQEDSILKKVLQYTLQGWPENPPEGLQRFYVRRCELSVENGLLIWGNRIVVPDKFRNVLLQELHGTHQGMTSMKRMARSLFWWPNLDKEIEDFVSACGVCQVNAPMPTESPPHAWPETNKPWSRLHIDYAGPIENYMLLIVIDSHSKWIEVCPVKSSTTTQTILELRQVFSRFGIPDTIVSDNGPQFASEEFEFFVIQNGIRHLRTAPYHPASNGLAERAVRIVKNGLAKNSEGDLFTRLARILMSYRRTPIAAIDSSPAELLLGRNIRCRLDLVKKNPIENHPKNTRTFTLGTKVLFRNYGIGEKWQKGEIAAVLGKRMFSIVTTQGTYCQRHVDQLRRLHSTPTEGDLVSSKFSRKPVVPFVCVPFSNGQVPVLGEVVPRVELNRPDLPIVFPRRVSTRARKPPNRLNW